MSKFTYKTKDGSKTGFVPNIGAIEDGRITSDTPLHNPNLELVSSDEQPAPIVGTASQQNPAQPLSINATTANQETTA